MGRCRRHLPVRAGTGPKPLPGQSVTVHITVWGKYHVRHDFQRLGRTKYPAQTPLTFKIGEGSVIKGLHDCVLGMRLGEIASLRCSPDDAYSFFGFLDEDDESEIEPYSIVELEIELLAVKERDEERKDDEGDEERKDDTPRQSKHTSKKPPHVSPAISTPAVSTKTQSVVKRKKHNDDTPLQSKHTLKVDNQSVVKRKKHNDEKEPSPKRSKRQHNPLDNVDSTISAKTISEVQPVNQSVVKRKKRNDESEPTPRRSKRQHNPLANVDSAISAKTISEVHPVNQSVVKRKKRNDESEPTPRRSKRQHNPLANVDSAISAKTISEVQPVLDVLSSASLSILAGDPQNLDSVGRTTVTQEAVLAPYIAPMNFAPAIQKTITQAPEGVAQESDPSKSLSHASGLTEASASNSPSGENKGNPSKDINPENLAANSHGTSPSKGANEEQNSPEHFELKEQMDLLEMGNIDSKGLTLLDINVQDYSSTVFDDPMGVIDRFLSNVLSSSHSQILAPGASVSETANSLPAELLSEFRSVAFTDNILETLKQGQDPTIRLQTIKTKINSNKELFTQGQLDEVENTVKFLNEFLSAYKRLGALQDSKGSIQQDIATSSMKLQQTGVKLAQAKESKRSHQSELSSVESRIKELEDELRKLNTRKESLQSESSTHDAKIETDMKILEQLMCLILRDKARLFKAEKETEYAKVVFDEHEKKYQALRNNVGCTVDGKDLKDQHQEIIDGNTEIFLE